MSLISVLHTRPWGGRYNAAKAGGPVYASVASRGGHFLRPAFSLFLGPKSGPVF